jgi:hypothetical protein
MLGQTTTGVRQHTQSLPRENPPTPSLLTAQLSLLHSAAMKSLPTRVRSFFQVAASVSALALAIPGCDDGDDSTGSTGTATDGTTSTTGASSSGAGSTGAGLTGADPSSCVEACANVDSCSPESYTAVGGEYTNEAECVVFCEAQYDGYVADGCGAEYAAIQGCLTSASCTDLVAFLTDPVTAGVCTAELTALGVCTQ